MKWKLITGHATFYFLVVNRWLGTSNKPIRFNNKCLFPIFCHFIWISTTQSYAPYEIENLLNKRLASDEQISSLKKELNKKPSLKRTSRGQFITPTSPEPEQMGNIQFVPNDGLSVHMQPVHRTNGEASYQTNQNEQAYSFPSPALNSDTSSIGQFSAWSSQAVSPQLPPAHGAFSIPGSLSGQLSGQFMPYNSAHYLSARGGASTSYQPVPYEQEGLISRSYSTPITISHQLQPLEFAQAELIHGNNYSGPVGNSASLLYTDRPASIGSSNRYSTSVSTASSTSSSRSSDRSRRSQQGEGLCLRLN